MKTEVKIIQTCGALVNFEGAGVLEILDSYLIVIGGPTGQDVCKIPLSNLKSVSMKGTLLIISTSEAECSVEFLSLDQQNRWALALRALLPPPGIKRKIKLLSMTLIVIAGVAIVGYYCGTIYIPNEKEICQAAAKVVDQIMGEPFCAKVSSLKKKSIDVFTGTVTLNDGAQFRINITRQDGKIYVESNDPAYWSAVITSKATLNQLTAMLRKNVVLSDMQCLRVEDIKSSSEFCTGTAILNDGSKIKVKVTAQGLHVEEEGAARISQIFLAATITSQAILDRVTAMLKEGAPQGNFRCLGVEEIKSTPELCTGIAVLNDGNRIKIMLTLKEIRIDEEDCARIAMISLVLDNVTKQLNHYKLDNGHCVRLEAWQSTGKPDCYSGIAVMDSGQKYKIKVEVDRDGQFLSISEPEFAKEWALEIFNERLKKNNSKLFGKDILKVKTIGDEKYSGILLMSDNSLYDVDFEVMGRYLNIGKITPRE